MLIWIYILYIFLRDSYHNTLDFRTIVCVWYLNLSISLLPYSHVYELHSFTKFEISILIPIIFLHVFVAFLKLASVQKDSSNISYLALFCKNVNMNLMG